MKAMAEALRQLWRGYGRQALPLVAVLLFVACAQLPLGPIVAVSESTSPEPSPAVVVATTAPDSEPGTDLTVDPATAAAAPLAQRQVLGMAVAVIRRAAGSETAPASASHNLAAVDALCGQIGDKLGSVSVEDCRKHGFVSTDGLSVHGRPLIIKELQPTTRTAADFRVLIMGGIHGDEYSSISILFKWLELFAAEGTEGEFYWRFAPLVNPDGLLDGNQARRQNANGVDLNRNFPSRDWNASAVAYWQQSTGSNPRRFPGPQAASEPEVQWLINQIEAFQPDVIVSLHAPYHLLDFDGPADAPDRIGELYLNQLGVYPGSLGNYAGLNRRIPVVTLELPSAGIMPPQEEIALMWHDLVAWLEREGLKGLAQSRGAGAVAAGGAGAAAP